MRRETLVGPDCDDPDAGLRLSIVETATIVTYFILMVVLCVIMPT